MAHLQDVRQAIPGRQAYHFAVPGADSAALLSVVSFTATEKMGAPIEVRVTLTHPQQLPRADYLNRDASFSITADDGTIRRFSGFIARFSTLQTTKDFVKYEIVLRSHIARLEAVTRNRIFQHGTTPDILKAIAQSHGLRPEQMSFRLRRTYPQHAFRMQYGMSDAAYAHMLMEKAGIYSYIVETEYGDQVVYGDDIDHYIYEPRLIVPYREAAGLEAGGVEAITSIKTHTSTVSQSFMVADYNPDAAWERFRDEANVAPQDETTYGQAYVYGTHHLDQAGAQFEAQLRHEAAIARQVVYDGESNVLALQCAGAMIGDEAAAVIRTVCLLLIEKSGLVLERVVGFLARFTKGNIVKLLEKIRFADYGDPLVKNLDKFFRWVLTKIQYAQGLLSRVEYIGRARELLAELERMEKRFYAVQANAVKQVPQALAKLDEALQKLLKDTMPPTYHPAYAGVPAPKPEVVAPPKVRVSPGIGEPPKLLPMMRDGAEVAGGAAQGGELPKPEEALPGSGNVHRKDVKEMTRAEKGIFGEKVSDDFMRTRGYRSELPEERQMRLLEEKPTGRGIDGVYMNGKPPPPYVITETKYRTGGKFDASNLPTTKGSEGYPSATQMSDDWIVPRLRQAVGEEKARMIVKTDYERWLMVVDESGEITSITKLNENAAALLDANRKPVTVPVK